MSVHCYSRGFSKTDLEYQVSNLGTYSFEASKLLESRGDYSFEILLDFYRSSMYENWLILIEVDPLNFLLYLLRSKIRVLFNTNPIFEERFHNFVSHQIIALDTQKHSDHDLEGLFIWRILSVVVLFGPLSVYNGLISFSPFLNF